MTLALSSQLHAQVDANRAPPPNRPSIERSSPEALQRELNELNAKINTLAGRMEVGRQAMETWQRAYKQIQDILASQAEHEAACLRSRDNLRAIEEKGDTPERFLAPSRRHVIECSEAAARLRTHVESLASEVLKSKTEVDNIEKAVGLEGQDREAMLRRAKVLEKVLQFSTDAVKGAITKYNDSRVLY